MAVGLVLSLLNGIRDCMKSGGIGCVRCIN